MFGQVSHQALHGLVLHHTDADKSGVLQARSEEVDTMNRPQFGWLQGWQKLLRAKDFLVAGACNHPNWLVITFCFELIRKAA
jgi:hypothetical protein